MPLSPFSGIQLNYTHDEYRPLIKGEVYQLDGETWPSGLVTQLATGLPWPCKGFERLILSKVLSPMRASGPLLHDNP